MPVSKPFGMILTFFWVFLLAGIIENNSLMHFHNEDLLRVEQDDNGVYNYVWAEALIK